ncbi:hypothetical protein B0H11DRAFT_2235250 [Mycena galericulata]|nr:hypothetical protein B0H11DRAFT_2235250 [Mycena galericulata]
MELESALRRVFRAMNDVGKRVAVLPGMALYPWPLQYGYDIARSTRRSANSVAMRARNAFLPLMATISLWFVLLDDQFDSSWRDVVVESSGVHPQWFADLQTSAVGDMTTPQVGGILDFTHQGDPVLTKKHDLEWLLPLILGKLPLPLYFHWGDITPSPTFRDRHRNPFWDASYGYGYVVRPVAVYGFRPDIAQITYLHDLPGEVAFSPWEKGRGPQAKMFPRRARPPAAVVNAGVVNLPASDSPNPEPDGPEVMSKFPQPEKDSGQLHGENIHAFLACRKARNEQLAKRETPQMTQKRLQREAHAGQGGSPGKKGPRVFVWEEENGFFIRRSINRSFAADRWNQLSHSEKRVISGLSTRVVMRYTRAVVSTATHRRRGL